LPAELRPHVDFVSNTVTIILAYCLRRLGVLQDEHVSGIRVLTFSICLPMVLGGALWTAELDSGLFFVVLLAAATNALQIALVTFCFAWQKGNLRGYYMMACLGNGLAYTYGPFLSDERFGARAMAISLCWDLGGNLWLATAGYGVIAAMFAQHQCQHDDAFDSSTLEDAPASQTVRSRTDVQRTQENAVGQMDMGQPAPSAFGAAHTSGEYDATEGGQAQGSELASDCVELGKPNAYLSRMQTVSGFVAAQVCRDLGFGGGRSAKSGGIVGISGKALCTNILKMPLLWGAFTGLGLCMARVPPHPIPLRVANTLANAFPPLIYVLLGMALQFNLGREYYGQVAKALICRWAVSALMILIVRQYPVDDLTRAVLTLSYACPTPATLIMFQSQFNYHTGRSIMTYNVGALVAVCAIQTLIHIA